MTTFGEELYAKKIICDKVDIDKIAQLAGFQRRRATFLTVFNSDTTATLGGKRGFYILSVDAASTPAPIRKVTLTFTPDPKPIEYMEPRVLVHSVAEQTDTNEVLFTCNVQKITDTTHELRIANNNATTNITTTLVVVLEVIFPYTA